MNFQKPYTFLALLAGLWCMMTGAALAQSVETNVLRMTGYTGTSTVPNHSGDIDISSFAWNVSVTIGSGGTGSKPVFSDITIYKPVDSTSPTLAQNCATGKTISVVTIFATGGAATGAYDAYTITIKNAFLTSVQSAPNYSAPAGVPTSNASAYESFTVHIQTGSTIQWSFVPLDSNRHPQTPIITSYNL